MSPIKRNKLSKIRTELDKLDNYLIKIIKKRTNLVQKVLKLKDKKNQIIDKKRINLETRIVYKSKLNSDFKPINNDSYGKTKKKNWFKNVISNKYLD